MDGYIIEMNKKFDYDNRLAHLQGAYFLQALFASVGNMFSKKGTKPIEYPKEPFDLGSSEKELSEDEIQKQRDAFVAQLMVMKSNFELSKKEV